MSKAKSSEAKKEWPASLVVSRIYVRRGRHPLPWVVLLSQSYLIGVCSVPRKCKKCIILFAVHKFHPAPTHSLHDSFIHTREKSIAPATELFVYKYTSLLKERENNHVTTIISSGETNLILLDLSVCLTSETILK